ncbi:MAG: YbaK/EbsC family protein [Actinobacteria bacterium]|nr:YbaK/EbsC family protein [Actinomycetota bacterium]
MVEHAPKTSRRAAAILGVREEEVIKTLIAWADEAPIVILLPASRHADLAIIASAIGAKEVRMAESSEVVTLTDYLLGATPPVGHVREMRTVMDSSVTNPPLVYCGGGEPNAILKIRPDDVVVVSGALVLDISED